MATDTETVTMTPSVTITDTPAFTPEAGLMMTMEPTIYTTTGGANLRSCPRTTCDAAGIVSSGSAIRVIGVINGESVSSGNAIWYVVDHGGETVYIYSNLARRGAPAPTQAPQVQSQPQQPVNPPPAGQVRPGNCATAVAMGLTAQEAAQWSHLDRDRDGVACYGD
jgi:hypothetical protein